MGGKPSFADRMRKYYSLLPDTNAALERVGLGGVEIPLTKEGIDTLQWSTLTSVPFENIDLFDYDIMVDWGADDLFDKIVTRRRGGYCFELNAFFMLLAKGVGFDAHAIAGRIMPADPIVGFEDYIPAVAHRMTIVTIGGLRYVADVGYGKTTAFAVPICVDTTEEQDIRGETFFVKDAPYNHKIVMQQTADGPKQRFMFNPDPHPVMDFVTFNSNMARTGFRIKRIANLRTNEGSISVDGNIFRETVNGERKETPIPTAEDAFKILTETYGMVLDPNVPLSAEGDRTPPPPPPQA
ncbi:MAG: arylamine N-acetyltransferase [Oscillospiraceae bacterium]|nr:arylamine N-acetyltransferase [Oscillospiraceae bacterium]